MLIKFILKRIVVLVVCFASSNSFAKEPWASQLDTILNMWGVSFGHGNTKIECPTGSKQIQKKISANGSSFGLECKLSNGLIVAIEASVWVVNRMVFENDSFSDCKSESELRKFLSNFPGEFRIRFEKEMNQYDIALQGQIHGENKRKMYWFSMAYCQGNSFYAEFRSKTEDNFSKLSSGWSK